MKTQSDTRTRIVSLENLKAMCARASGTCHRFEVTKVSRSRVHVEYSNPNEYGSEFPIVAVFPAIPGHTQHDTDNPRVVLGELLRTIGGRAGAGSDREDWQAFDQIMSGPSLWRSADIEGNDRDGYRNAWKSRQDLNGSVYLCPDGVIRTVDWNHPYTDSTFGAFEVTAETPPETFKRIGGNRRWAFFTWTELKPASVVTGRTA